jgi:hypothetical protein
MNDEISLFVLSKGPCITSIIRTDQYKPMMQKIILYFQTSMRYGVWSQKGRNWFYDTVYPMITSNEFDLIEMKDESPPENKEMTPFDVTACNIVRQNKNSMVIYNELGHGTYGSVYNAVINGCNVAMKISNGKTKSTDVNMLSEGLIHIILQCTHKQITAQIPRYVAGWEWPFPSIKMITKIKYGEKNEELMVATSKLSMTLHTLLSKYDISKPYLNDVLVQIVIKLYWLQKTVSFVHRDMHTGNVMMVERNIPEDRTYIISDRALNTASYYRIYFIDMGKIRIDLRSCNLCEINMDFEPSTVHYGVGKKVINGPGYDLRVLFGVIYKVFYHRRNESKIMKYFGKKAWKGLDMKGSWHQLLKTVHPTNPEIFEPINVFNTIVDKKLLQ